MIAGCNVVRAYFDPPVPTAIAFLVDATRTGWYETDFSAYNHGSGRCSGIVDELGFILN
jgi:hypothetical protein